MKKTAQPNPDQDSSNQISVAKAIEMWAIEKLKPYDRNARTHSSAQVNAIAASMQEFGFTNPILVDSEQGIIAGHGRLLAAQQLGLKKVPVIVLDHLTPAQRKAYVLADNKLAEMAGWDNDLLAGELKDLMEQDFNIGLVGFSQEEIDQILGSVDECDSVGLTDEDAAPEAPEVATSRSGDVWLLDRHRLMCGDATSSSDVENLMRGAKADLIFTDPPYNVDYQGYTNEKLKIQSDKMSSENFIEFLNQTFRSYFSSIKSGASMYVCHPDKFQREFQNAIEGAGFSFRCQIIWAKNTFAWGFGRYKFQHEPIFYCHVSGQSDAWYGDKTQSTLWHEKKPAANRLHPTMKPVELIERALLNSSKAGDLVLDLFGGSGSTLIAAEKNKRLCNSMELDPKYADVIVNRWQEFTGKQAKHEVSGLTFAEEADARRA